MAELLRLAVRKLKMNQNAVHKGWGVISTQPGLSNENMRIFRLRKCPSTYDCLYEKLHNKKVMHVGWNIRGKILLNR